MGSAARPHDASLALTRPKEISPQDIGFLRLDDLLRDWRSKLDGTRLVVLSACDTGRGATVGDSAMALPWGFFFAGARTVVASLWRVDDEATALLMARFYENLLGTFEKPRKIGGEEYAPGKALHVEPALREAKAWLRSLSRVEAEAERKRLSDLAEGFEKTIAAKDGQSALVPSRGPGGEVDAPTVRTPVGERPYAHPYFWAAFVCVGSPE
jgi:CHAT domain-containing protein